MIKKLGLGWDYKILNKTKQLICVSFLSNFPRSLPLIEKENLSITVRMQMSVVEIKQICVFTTSKCDLVIPRRSFSRFQFDEFVYEKVCALLNATSLWMQISAFGNF